MKHQKWKDEWENKKTTKRIRSEEKWMRELVFEFELNRKNPDQNYFLLLNNKKFERRL